MAGFTKLFSSIVDSTIWRADPITKVVWITMLAKADKNGMVFSSLPGLADAARVSIEQCQAALNIFTSPDEFSRSKDFEGRRVLEVEGGWLLLNYIKYRKMQDEDELRIATAERVRKYRAKFAQQEEGKPVTDVTKCNTVKQNVPNVVPGNAIAEAEAEAEADKKSTYPTLPKGRKLKLKLSTFSPQATELAFKIKEFWPDANRGAVQPDHNRTPVPIIKMPLLGDRLTELIAQGCDPAILEAIAKRVVQEWRDGNWIKAPQHFFGKSEDAPWSSYYKAHLTNEAE